MRKSFLGGLIALLLAFSPTWAEAGLVINQYWSSAPNAYGSPSWTGYVANAQTGIQGGGVNVGDRNTDPTAYQILSSFTPGDMMVTSFTSWRGLAGPTGAFVSELGNRLHNGAMISSNIAFTLADVSFSFGSSDHIYDYVGSFCPLGGGGSLCYQDDLAGTNFGDGRRVGIYFGGDGVLGGSDDIVYNSGNPGNDSVLINTLYYIGPGNAFWPGGDLVLPSSGTQTDIDATAAYINANVSDVYNTFCVKNQSCGTSTIHNADVPEPSSASLFGLSLIGLAGFLGFTRSRRSATTA